MPVVAHVAVVVDQGDEGDVDVGEAAELLQAGGGGHVEGRLVGRPEDTRQASGHALKGGVVGRRPGMAPSSRWSHTVHRRAGPPP